MKGSTGNLNETEKPEMQSANYISSVVRVGSVPMGGTYPVRIQSMTNTDTLDTKSSVDQCIRLAEAGSDYVRLTAQGIREAQNLPNIKNELRKAGFETPLIADIHFNPAVAELAARFVEKVRINPGNYADKRASFKKVELSGQEYELELERIHTRILPLIKICREYGTAVRIGVNHGSLSDRIMTRYGNTVEGMVVSAMEFIRIFRAENFHQIVLSMKSSNLVTMISSTRMLAERMSDEGYFYPIHLGVTEAGEGEDGIIKSSAGIGALLAEGIGDTIRVSLTGEPVQEIPVAKEIVRYVCGPTERIVKPAEKIPFVNRSDRYRPEVLIQEGDRFISENGENFNGRVITFNSGEWPSVERAEHLDTAVNPVFNEDDLARLAIQASASTGRYFVTGIADAICITNKGKIRGEKLRELSFSILQATEARITRNRYVSCPTCGRTRFNLQETVRKVKSATGHFSGLKIAVMGCIVNGPGEMAGADYGYVGTTEGKVHIYRGPVPVLKNIPEQDAVAELVKLIEKDQTSL
ncbi:MAG: (E)-4-hydroxy-3-methylbut-2-enyl-diphosphate synthase [Bacteroidales bacterium]|nr:(E)-4-hydroxy-3-methylbut-2-enyl-diphosphate synthase [Bacteroidales bacterium]